MSQKISRTSLVEYLHMILCLISIASIIIGSIGAWCYAKEKRNQSNCKPTMCFVQDYLLLESKCPIQQCNPMGLHSSCTTKYYTCYLDTYVVIYNVSDRRQIQSTIIAKHGPGPKSINGTYQCYYSSTNETSVRWTWSNSNQYLIMLCVGWAFFGLVTIGLILWIILTCLYK